MVLSAYVTAQHNYSVRMSGSSLVWFPQVLDILENIGIVKFCAQRLKITSMWPPVIVTASCWRLFRGVASRGLEGRERLAALSARCLPERGGAAQAGTGQEPANQERGGQNAHSAAQLSTAGTARHAEGNSPNSNPEPFNREADMWTTTPRFWRN